MRRGFAPGAAILGLTPAQAQALFAFNRVVFDRFVRRSRGLPWRAVRRNREIGHGSIFDTLVHILNVHEVWIGYIVQGRGSDAELEVLFADRTRHPTNWPGFRRYRRRVWQTVDTYVARLSPAQLARPVHAFWMPGRYVVADALLQTTFEQAHHLGEIIGALWQDDRPSPPMTWIEVTRAMAARRLASTGRPRTRPLRPG